MSDLILSHIGRAYGKVEIITDLDLQVNDGEFVVLVGPSGCGKSTLLRLIAGLDKPNRGTVTLDGRDVTAVPAAERGLAMVFQSYALYPHMSVRQNLSFGLENTRMARADVVARVDEAARMLQIEPLLDRKPGQLSGGQRQRVAIGRAIVRRPGIFLLDEPLSNLDAELRVAMRAELAALQRRLKATMIYVTHDQVEAMTLADRIVVLRKGVVEQVGAPLDLFNRPANKFVAGFIGSPHMNFVTATLAAADRLRLPGGVEVALPAALAGANAGAAVTVGIRPQHIALAAAGLAAEVTLVEALGTETVLHLRLAAEAGAGAVAGPGSSGTAGEAAGDRLIVALSGQVGVAAGDLVHLAPDPARLHVFGPDERRWPGT